MNIKTTEGISLSQGNLTTRPGAVYFLVEPGRFKIGRSVDVAQRSKKVAPELIEAGSWAVFFDDYRDAMECETVLHKVFRKYRLPKINRDGGTELFDMGCFELVGDFVTKNQGHLLYSDIKRGDDLFPLLTQIEITGEQLARREKREFKEKMAILEPKTKTQKTGWLSAIHQQN